MLKLPQVARRLGVSEKTARRYIKAGTIPSAFVGNAYRVREEDVEEYMRQAQVTPGESETGKAQTPQPSPEGAVRVIQIKGEVSERTRRKPWSITVTHTWGLEDVLEDVEAGRTEEAAGKLRELIGSTA